MIAGESIRGIADFSIALTALMTGALLFVNMIVARGIKIPAALCSLTDLDRTRIIISYVVFMVLCGVCHLDGYLQSSELEFVFTILHVLAAVSGWELVVVALYYRTKLLVTLFN